MQALLDKVRELPYIGPKLYELLAGLFDATTGHTHDGTAGNGGPIGASGIAAGAVGASELGVTAGTVTASKAVVVDANLDAGDFRNLDAVNIDAGASGTAGTVDVFPATASKGKLAIACTDQTGNTTVSLNANAMGQATAINIPDPGAAAGYVAMTSTAKTAAQVDAAITAAGTASQVANAVAGVAASYKVARGVTAVTGTQEVTTGLATVVSIVAMLAEDPSADATIATGVIPTQTGGDAGKATLKVWKPTAADNSAPTAALVAKNVTWVAIGT
jgi:hypothetical protein